MELPVINDKGQATASIAAPDARTTNASAAVERQNPLR